ncbi:recombinase family protein [Sphaerisporangium sp. NBC_01403]|uniref:recombinase family protein n=1 Tax=Sphaerisporangium sp. NBC_01403 TaxID=2903599 RepID=UPI00325114E4
MAERSTSVPVVSYARISADTKRDGHGVKDQHKVNRETAARHGWTVVHEFTDNDKSAARLDVVRDDFENMLTALVAGKLPDGTAIRGVVVVADDRLARRPGDYERFLDAFTHNEGFVFADAKQDIDLYNEDAETMGLIGVVFSKKEVRKIARRTRQGHRRRAEQGIPVGGHRPFGWQHDRITLDPVEAELIRTAAQQFIAGRSLGSIANEWQRNGVLTPRGNQWITKTIKRMFLNARNCGWRELHGELVRDGNGDPVVGAWEPILTTDEWMAVRALIDTRKGKQLDNNGTVVGILPQDFRDHRYLLTGVLRCGRPKEGGGICNKLLRVKTYAGKKPWGYVCESPSAGGCSGVGRRGDLVDFFISELVIRKMEEAQFAEAQENGEWPNEQEFAKAQERLEEMTRHWEEGKVSNDHYFRMLPRLEKNVNRLRAEEARFRASAERRQSRARIDVAEIQRRWYLPEDEGGMPLSQKRTHIREALHAVIVHPSGRGNKPFNPDLLEPIWRE